MAKSLRPILQGEEINVSYGYMFNWGPDWYKDLFLQFMADNPGNKYSIKSQQVAKSRGRNLTSVDYFF